MPARIRTLSLLDYHEKKKNLGLDMAASAATSARASSSLSQSEEDALKVAVFQRLHPRTYLERFLAENIRPDKRLCDGFRDVHVNVGEFFFFFFKKKEGLGGVKKHEF